jgi:hypothetical protein
MKTSKLTREKKLELYNILVTTQPGAILKGDTIPYTSLNGHMYSFLSKQDELSLRLPADEIPGFLKKYKTRLAENYGVVQKEYVFVPDELLINISELKKYFQKSHAYVLSLKPKPSSKTKK